MKNSKLQTRWAICCGTGIAVAAVLSVGAGSRDNYVVHEWGTFTSLQGGDGELLNWKPLETSRLPKFVYDWKHAGLNRVPAGSYIWGKGEITGLQRMETPVIYFYSQKEREVNVSVDFPQGIITEWFPQAAQIGPSTRTAPVAISTADNMLHRAGAKPDFSLASWFDRSTTKESRARWPQVHVMPAKENRKLDASLHREGSGSHYYSARETDSAFVETDSLVSTNQALEVEKFIFYRGVGNFATPLRVTMTSQNGMADKTQVTITNTGDENLEHFFVLSVRHGAGKFLSVKKLAVKEQVVLPLDPSNMLPVGALADKLGSAMKDALVSSGLYPREAAAMVATWKDSWFEEDGFRVLYILPRAWTDKILPLKLDPAPQTLTRVMVGRAEVLTPASQRQLILTLTEAEKGNAQMHERAAEELKRLGRFAEPALQLAGKTAPEAGQTGWKVLQTLRQPSSPLE